MFDTHSFRSIDTGGVGTSNHAAGLMAISISRTPRDYVMLFRRNRILDINLGDETRFRLAMRLRAVSMRFYFVSASSDEAGLNAGFAGTVALRKPYAKSDLYEAVTAVLKVSNPSVLTAVSQQYAKMIEQQFALGDRLRQSLANDGWRIVNDTRLPLVCFAPDDAAHVVTIEREIAGAGEAWISSVTLRGAPCLRACITGFETTEDDVDTLVAMLARARNRCAG